jgi:tetratricopeptide (TPR) repeat protein
MRTSRFFFVASVLAVGVLAGCVSGPSFQGRDRGRIPPDQESLFEAAKAAYDRGAYGESENLFEKIISSYPGSPLLMETQWLLGRSYENRGDWQRALVQYRSYQANFPKGPRAEEARLRMEMIEGIRRRQTRPTETPALFGVELTGKESVEDLQSFRSRGVNAVLIDDSAVGSGSGSDTINGLRSEGFLVMAVLRFNPADLFGVDTRLRIQERLIEFGALKMDGVLFDAEPVPASDWYRPEILRLASDAFGVSIDQNALHGDPALYWKWAGWRGRQVAQRLLDAVEPVRSARLPFYWGVVFPPEAITAPNQFLAESGLDLLEAKNTGADYFGIRTENREDAPMILQKARDLIGEARRVAMVMHRTGGDIRPSFARGAGGSVLFLTDGGTSQGGLTKNLP